MRPALIDAVCGPAWAAGLRGLLSVLAGPQSEVSWYGTFVQIMLPGVLTGALLGHSVRQKDRLLVLAPLLLIAILELGCSVPLRARAPSPSAGTP